MLGLGMADRFSLDRTCDKRMFYLIWVSIMVIRVIHTGCQVWKTCNLFPRCLLRIVGFMCAILILLYSKHVSCSLAVVWSFNNCFRPVTLASVFFLLQGLLYWQLLLYHVLVNIDCIRAIKWSFESELVSQSTPLWVGSINLPKHLYSCAQRNSRAVG